MIGYATVGTNDLERARAFFDALFGTIGATRKIELPHGFTLYGKDANRPGIVVTPPYDGQQATPGNGAMIAIPVRSRDIVNAFHAKASSLGAATRAPRDCAGPKATRRSMVPISAIWTATSSASSAWGRRSLPDR